MTVNTTIATDWFTFLIAIIVSNLLFVTLLSNFSSISIDLRTISYNTFFTLLFFPFFWFFFSFYNSMLRAGKNV